jgi:hypothetical protein
MAPAPLATRSGKSPASSGDRPAGARAAADLSRSGTPPTRDLNTKTAKFQRLVRLLEESASGLSIRHIAATLSVDERTVKRYLADLRRLKFDLRQEADGRGRKTLYRIPAPEGPPPALLAGLKRIRSELHAGGNPKHGAHISKVIRFLEDPASAAANGATRKAAPASPASGTAATEAGPPSGHPGAELYHIDHGPFAEADPHPGILKILESAVAERMAIKVSYSGYAKSAASRAEAPPRTGETSRPEAEEFLFFPYILALRVGTLYLIGRQGENKGPFKSLLVRRIRRCIATRDTFKPDAFRAEDYYRYTFGQWHRQLHEEPETVVLLLKAPWLEKYLGESRFNPPGRLLRKGGETHFELKVVIKPDFVNWVMSLVPDLLPLKPEGLRDQVAERLRRAAEDLAKL